MGPKGNNKIVKANKPANKTPVKSILKDTKSPAKQNNKSVKIDSKVQVSQKKGKKKFDDDEEEDDEIDNFDEEELEVDEDNEIVDDENEEENEEDDDEMDNEEENDDDEEDEEEENEDLNASKNNKRKQAPQSTPSKKPKVEANKINKSSTGNFRAFIRNISRQSEEKDLFQFFKNNGLTPVDVSVPRKPDGSSKGFGFAGFTNQNDLEKACGLDGSELNGSTLSISVSNDPRESQKTKTLLIKNLSNDVDEDTLSSNFSGSVGCRVITYNGVSKGFGFVDFSSEAEAENALNQMQGATINNQQIYVAFAQPKSADRRNSNNSFNGKERSGGFNKFNNRRGGNNGGKGGNRGNYRGGNRGNRGGSFRGNHRSFNDEE